MVKFLYEFLEDESGLTVVEYVIGAAVLVGTISSLFLAYDDKLSASINSTLSK